MPAISASVLSIALPELGLNDRYSTEIIHHDRATFISIDSTREPLLPGTESNRVVKEQRWLTRESESSKGLLAGCVANLHGCFRTPRIAPRTRESGRATRIVANPWKSTRSYKTPRAETLGSGGLPVCWSVPRTNYRLPGPTPNATFFHTEKYVLNRAAKGRFRLEKVI